MAATIGLLCLLALISIPLVAAGESCTLTVLSIPDKAAITIDGTLIGSAPLSGYELSCGNHTVSVGAKGYADHVVEKTLLRGNPGVIIANLRRLEDRGTVYITSDPEGGDLYIDGILKGTTPLLVDALTPGPHALLIRKTNYEDYTDTVIADPGMIPEYHDRRSRDDPGIS